MAHGRSHKGGSTLKASNLLGFSAKTKLESGLNELYRSEATDAA